MLRCPRALLVQLLPAVVLVLGAPLPAQASCDVIPGARDSFRGALGTLNRPYAIPGDVGEEISVTLERKGCDGASPGFVGSEHDHFVTVVFTPPAGPRNAVITTTPFRLAECEARRAACEEELGEGGTATCLAAEGGRGSFDVRSPTELRFRFPDTDALLAPAGDDRTLSGPATVAVTRVEAPLPCGLAKSRCAACLGDPSCTAPRALVACVDEIYERDGTCRVSEPASVFAHFTALPPANDYEALCRTPEVCTGLARELRFTTDADGNVLLPVDWRGVLVNSDRIPIPRLVNGASVIEAFRGGAAPIRIPGRSFLASFSPGGLRLPPLFQPLADAASADAISLFGSVDAPVDVVRLARRGPEWTRSPPTFRQCEGGANDGLPCVQAEDCAGAACGQAFCVGGSQAGQPCSIDAACGGGECGPGLFEFRDRFAAGVGPVVIPNNSASLALEATNPIPLDGLIESTEMFAFVSSEAIDGQRHNQDDDERDLVVQVRDRATGAALPIGEDGAGGRATLRVWLDRSRKPAVAVEDDVVAFLEPEPLEGNRDRNGDDDAADTILRVFRLEQDCAGAGPCAEPLLTGPDLAVDAAPFLNGRSLVVSDGLVYFRVSEAANALAVIERVSVGLGGSDTDAGSSGAVVSDDGRIVAFTSAATNLVAGDANFTADVFVHDREAGSIKAVSVHGDGVPAGGGDVSISGDGRLVAFSSSASLVAEDGNGITDVYVRDRASGTSRAVSLVTTPSTVSSSKPWLSRDGRFISYSTSNYYGTYIHVHEVASALFLGSFFASAGAASALSSNGEWLVRRQDSGNAQVLLRNLLAGTERFVAGVPLNAPPYALLLSGQVSDDGRYVTFSSDEGNEVAGDTNGMSDSFLRDVTARETIRTSVGPDGSQVDEGGGGLSLSQDGRYVGLSLRFRNPAGTLFSGAFRYDRHTGLSQDLTPGIEELPLPFVRRVGLAGDGRHAVFDGSAPLDSADGNGTDDVYLWGPDSSDPLGADRTGDGDLDDVVLEVVETRAGMPVLRRLGPADQVAVAAGHALFLSPERALGLDLDGDGDSDDRVVHLHLARSAPPPLNLGIAAEGVALSDEWIAVLRSEAADGNAGDLDGDRDTDDLVVAIQPLATASPDGWRHAAVPARSLAVVGARVVFVTPAGELHLIHAEEGATPSAVSLGLTAEDFVLGEQLLAFRTSERAEGRDLNGDGDQIDSVLHVQDLASGQLFNTQQAAIPCPLEACDPSLPYRVAGSTVTFLTAECEQGGRFLPERPGAGDPIKCEAGGGSLVGCRSCGTDLNADGDAADLVKQVFNAAEAVAMGAGPDAAACVRRLAAATAGICTSTGLACVTGDECADGGGGGGTCYVPPGECLVFGGACDPEREDSGQPNERNDCVPEEACSAQGLCFRRAGPCAKTSDCPPGGECVDAAADSKRIFAPLALDGSGSETVMSAGSCVEDLAQSCVRDEECVSGVCGGEGRCERRHGSCLTAADCTAGQRCAANLVIGGAADADFDGLADPLDNCPARENPDQLDQDADGIGDACDRATCGNGLREEEEACDDANRFDGDGCSASCLLESVDEDADGVPDERDNCVSEANGPDAGPNDQLDTDHDGIGNLCDCDLDESGFCNLGDFNLFFEDLLEGVDSGRGSDQDGDGEVDLEDLSTLLAGLVRGAPGSSGLPCAGSVPCPVPGMTCADALLIPPVGGSFVATTSGPSLEAGSCGGEQAPEFVFSWVPDSSGTATIQTCGVETEFDSVLHVRRGSCSEGEELACNDQYCANAFGLVDASRVTLQVTAGETYWIFVDGFDAEALGQFRLTVSPPGVESAACAEATPVAPDGGLLLGRTEGFSSTGRRAFATDRLGEDAPEKVFAWTPVFSGPAVIETCGPATEFDTALYMRQDQCAGGSPSSGADPGSDDACANAEGSALASRINPFVGAGQPYFIFVDGYGTEQGDFGLRIHPPGASCQDAIDVPSQGGVFRGRTSELLNTLPSCGAVEGPEQVFRWRPGVATRAVIDLVAVHPYGAILAYGDACPGTVLDCIRTSSDVGHLEFDTSEDKTYFIRVEPGRAAEFTLTVSALCVGSTVVPFQGGIFTGTAYGASFLEGSCVAGRQGLEAIFEWTPFRSGTARIEAVFAEPGGTPVPAAIYVRADRCGGTEVTCASEGETCGTNTVSVEVEAGRTYFIVIEPPESLRFFREFPYALGIDPPGPKLCANATPIPPVGGSFSADAVGSPRISGSCGGAASRESLFVWTPAHSGIAFVRARYPDEVDELDRPTLHIRRASVTGNLCGGEEVACSSLANCLLTGGEIRAVFEAGVSYVIFAEGRSGAASTRILLDVQPPAPVQPSCEEAVVIPSEGGSVADSIVGPGRFQATCGGQTTGDAVFQWTPAASGIAVVDVGDFHPGFPPALSLRKGVCNEVGEIACERSGCLGSPCSARLVEEVEAGVPYFIFLEDNEELGGGDFTLQVTAPGDTHPSCEAVTPIVAEGGRVEGTISGSSGLLGSCGGFGAERIFEWTPDRSGMARIELVESDISFPNLYVREGDCFLGEELACETLLSFQTSLGVEIAVEAGRSYFIFVDASFSGAAGGFAFVLTAPEDGGCGLGAELALLIPPLAWLRSRLYCVRATRRQRREAGHHQP